MERGKLQGSPAQQHQDGSGLSVQGKCSEYRVEDAGFRIQGARCRVQGAGFACRHTDHHGQLEEPPAQHHQDGARRDPERTLGVASRWCRVERSGNVLRVQS